VVVAWCLVVNALQSLNLLVMADNTVKVSDFGTSKWIQQTASMTANVGSPMWSAPEVLRYSKYSEKADIYRYVSWSIVYRERD
jgi:serine/threonine protein kinase